MLTIHALIRRLTVTVGLAAALLISASLLGPVATADPGIPFTAVPASPLEVQARGTTASVRVTSAEPALFSVTLTSAHGTTTPCAYRPFVRDHRQLLGEEVPRPSGEGDAGVGGGWTGDGVGGGVHGGWTGAGACAGVHGAQPTYKTDHAFTLADLRSNTAYTLEVTATTVFGQTLSHSASFTTAKLRARLVLDKIVVHDDGDWVGKGEPTWFWSMTWDGGRTGGCYPYQALCEAGSTGEGTLYPTNPQGEKLALLFAEENFPAMPERFTLLATADESDVLPLGSLAECISGGCEFIHISTSTVTLQVPRDRESSSESIVVPAYMQGHSMKSTMYFRFETFHDQLPYPPNRGSTRVHHNY